MSYQTLFLSAGKVAGNLLVLPPIVDAAPPCEFIPCPAIPFECIG